MIIATAGHVDHGKTTLLQALTGINADRLPEEKKRGMTIDLGYAYWPQDDGRVLGFIDVPGHEKFLANMLAGVGGIDHALLVVACDDGVMAQTREHLAILQLTGQPALTVALTKADRVDSQRVEQVRLQVLALVAEMGWANAPLFVTAAARGDGIEALRHHLRMLSPRTHLADSRFRLAIDRAFTIKGAGLVVTGTALSGQVKIGDSLWLTGADTPVRVRGIHAQDQTTEQAGAGQRIALNITGSVEKADVSRGDWLLAQQPLEPVERLIVALEHCQPLGQWQPLHIHHGASHITGRVSLLENHLAELVLDSPLWLADNDRLVLRDISAKTTLGGARAILLHPPKRGKRQPAFLHWLAELAAAGEDHGRVLDLHLSHGAVASAEFGWARQLTAQGMGVYLADRPLIQAGGWLLSDATALRWQEKLLAVLERYHQQHDDQPGPGRERLRRMALPAEPEPLVLALVERMRQQHLLESRQGWLHLPGHQPGFTPHQEALWQAIAGRFADDPWWVRDLAKETGVEEAEIRQLMRLAAQLGYVVAVVKDRYFLQSRIQAFAELIRELDQEKGSTDAADFRDQLGVGRKLAIQILEFFDRSGFTRRRGNDRILRDSALFTRA